MLGDDLFLTGRALFRETRNIRLYVLREIFRLRWRPSAAVFFGHEVAAHVVGRVKISGIAGE